jgi:ABC-type transport system involved in Fe-S cluster assembly fused permease/ATPase subunit
MSTYGRGLKNLRTLVSLALEGTGSFVRARMALALLLLLAGAGLAALTPVALKLIVDSLAGQASFGAFTLIGAYILSQWFSRVVVDVRTLVYARADKRMQRMLSRRMFDRIMRLPLTYHLDRRTGAVNQIIATGLNGYQVTLQHLVFTFLPVLVELVTVAVVLIKFDQAVFVGIFLVALCSYAIVYGIGVKRLAGPVSEATLTQIHANAFMTDSILNAEAVKCLTAEEMTDRKYDQAMAKVELAWGEFFRRVTLNGIFIATVFAGFLAATLLYAAYQVERGAMTIGGFVLINTYILQIVRPVESLGMAVQQMSQGFAFIDKFMELFDQQPEIERPQARPLSVCTDSGVRFENVSYSYRPDRTVIRDVSFEVAHGTVLGVVGASGSGKSTLGRLLARLVEPIEGRIRVGGVPGADLSLRELRQSIGIVQQETMLFNDSIGYNIACARPGCSPEEIERAAKLARLHEFVVSLPEGYETQVGEKGAKLSGGEKQRIAIARAVLKDPQIYLFDEATSSLDTKTERAIMEAIREISRQRTTLIIAHRLSTVVHADQIIVLEQGAIVERGTHATLLDLGGRYASLWNAQQATKDHEKHAAYI